MKILALKAWRDALAHKGQFFALIVLVSLGIMSFVTFQNSYFNLEGSLQQAYSQLHLPHFTVQVDNAPLGAARRVEGIPGVAAARVRTVRDVGMLLEDGRQATARIVSMPDDWRTDVSALHVEAGQLSESGRAGQVVLHPKFSIDTGIGVGDHLTLRIEGRRVPVRVAALGVDPDNLYPLRSEGDLPSPGEFAIVYVTEAEAGRLFGLAGAGNNVAVVAEDGERVAEVLQRVEDHLRPYGVVSSATRAQNPSYSGLQAEVDQNRVMAQSVPVLVLAIGVMSIFIALSRLVQSQRGEIGLAKALGYGDGQILGHYLMYGVLLSTGGSVLGIGLGLVGAHGLSATYVSFLGLPFMESGFYPRVVAVAVALSVAACIAAALVPAYRSARLAPAVAMHSDPNKTLAGGKIPLAEKLLGPLLPRSFTFRVPLRNVFRARRRSLYTVLGIAFAMVLSVVTISMFDSIDYLLDKAFVEVERWDVVAVFEQPVGTSRVADVGRISEVHRVQPALIVPVTVSSGALSRDVSLTAMRPDADFHGFTHDSGAQPRDALAAGELVLSASTAAELGVTAGERVMVDSPWLDDPVEFRVGSLSEEMLGQPAYVSASAATRLTNLPAATYNAVYLDTEPGTGERISDELYDMAGVASVQVKEGLIERLESLLELFNAFGTVLLLFGSALAFVVVYTTFSANVSERTREIATMRTIGEDSFRLAVMVTLENLIIAVAALPLGIWLGVRAAEAVFAQFETDSYNLQAVIFPESIVRICVLMLVVLLLSEIPPIRRIFRLDLAEATKVME